MTVHPRFRFQQALTRGSFGLILTVLMLLLVREGFSLFEIGLFAALFSLNEGAASRKARPEAPRVSLW